MTDDVNGNVRLSARNVRSKGPPPEPPERGQSVFVTGGAGWREAPLAGFPDPIDLL